MATFELTESDHELVMRALERYIEHWLQVRVTTESINMATVAEAKVRRARELGERLRAR